MYKKLQVFISSTFLDLIEERQAVVQAILGARHLPAGMELFCAGDKSQLITIKQWIDQSDVFMLILGGRYGSIDPESGKSYVQLEYEHAVHTDKPLFAAVIGQDYIDQMVRAKGKDVLELDHPDLYKGFRKLVTSKMCRFFSDTKDLKLIVHESLRDIDQCDGLVGWVRADDEFAPRAVAQMHSRSAISLEPITSFLSTARRTTELSFKPTIGVTLDYRSTRKDSAEISFAWSGYYDSISRAGGRPLLIPPLHDDCDIDAILDMVDGVVLVGGADLDPRVDGFMLHPSSCMMEARREKFDRKLMAIIAERRTPVFGIGVGMQLINVSQGGNLFLHIPEDLPKALHHSDPSDPTCRHALVVEANSLMERVYGKGDCMVVSMHHMAIDSLASGFAVTARGPDGVIEAIESTRDDWFALGTQFHPEVSWASTLDLRIFEEFVEGCSQRKKRKRGHH